MQLIQCIKRRVIRLFLITASMLGWRIPFVWNVKYDGGRKADTSFLMICMDDLEKAKEWLVRKECRGYYE